METWRKVSWNLVVTTESGVVVAEARPIRMRWKSGVSEALTLVDRGVEWIDMQHTQVFDIEPLIGSHASDWFLFR